MALGRVRFLAAKASPPNRALQRAPVGLVRTLFEIRHTHIYIYIYTHTSPGPAQPSPVSLPESGLFVCSRPIFSAILIQRSMVRIVHNEQDGATLGIA
jgi:hypothetical protein